MNSHRRTIAVLAVVSAGVLVSVAQLTAAQHDADAHGEFTGDIKSVLYVADVEDSAAFFEQALGFEFLGFSNRADGTPYYAELSAGGRKFGLHEPVNEEQQQRIGQQRIYFRVRDLGAHRRRLVAHGVEVPDTVLTDWMDFVIVHDQDGHEIVFAVTDPARHGIDPW